MKAKEMWKGTEGGLWAACGFWEANRVHLTTEHLYTRK